MPTKVTIDPVSHLHVHVYSLPIKPFNVKTLLVVIYDAVKLPKPVQTRPIKPISAIAFSVKAVVI